MDKSSITKQMLSGNNTLNSIIVRIDFLTIDVEELVEKLLMKLGEEYTYNNINSYNIDLDIADPKKLITQDFINQKVNLNNNYEFKNNNEDFRFVINENFFLYQRKTFNNYEGSDKDTALYKELLNIVFEKSPKIQRLGVRKTNLIFLEQDIEFLKEITDNEFIKTLNEKKNQKFNILYTPLDDNQKNGYNINTKLDYGKLKIESEEKEVYRFVLDIDSYIRDIQQIDSYEEVCKEIDELKIQDFELYKSQMSEKFLQAISEDNEDEFKSKMKNLGIVYGVNYGKH